MVATNKMGLFKQSVSEPRSDNADPKSIVPTVQTVQQDANYNQTFCPNLSVARRFWWPEVPPVRVQMQHGWDQGSEEAPGEEP